MNWLTQEEIKEAAKTKRGAIRGSRLHWEQMKDATQEEFNSAYGAGKTGLRPEYCALCAKYRTEGKDDCVKDGKRCVLWQEHKLSRDRCGPEFVAAVDIFPCRHTNWQAWKKASTNMWLRLVNEEAKCDIETLEPEAKEEKKEIRHGSYGHYRGGGLWWAWEREGVLELFGKISGAGRPAQDAHPDIVVDGNCVDDLSGEDLEEFEVDGFRVRKNCYHWDKLVIGGKDFSLESAEKLFRKGLRVVMSIKKRKCKDGDC